MNSGLHIPGEPQTGDPLDQILDVFKTRLNSALTDAGFPTERAARYSALAEAVAAGRGLATAQRWCLGTALPNPAILVKIAEITGTTVDWLLGRDVGEPLRQIPVMSSAPGITPRGTHDFTQVSCFGLPQSIAGQAGAGSVFVRLWETLTEPPLKEGALLLLDVSGERLVDDSTYLMLTRESIQVRVVRRSLDNKIQVTMETARSQFKDTFALEDFAFKSDKTFNTPNPPGDGQIVVLGRVVANFQMGT